MITLVEPPSTWCWNQHGLPIHSGVFGLVSRNESVKCDIARFLERVKVRKITIGSISLSQHCSVLDFRKRTLSFLFFSIGY
jgi:hypothetical protein